MLMQSTLLVEVIKVSSVRLVPKMDGFWALQKTVLYRLFYKSHNESKVKRTQKQ